MGRRNKRRSLVIIQMVFLVINLVFFTYNITIRSILIVDKRSEDDSYLPSEIMNHIPDIHNTTPVIIRNECLNSSVAPTTKMPVKLPEAVTFPGAEVDIDVLRMSLLKDALADLERVAKGIQINYAGYKNLTSKYAKDSDVLCKYYADHGRISQYSLPRIWSDTGFYNKEDVTYVTQITISKLGTLNRILMNWPGPVSCSVYLDKHELSQLPSLISKFPTILQRENIDLHLAIKTGILYPINYLRNLALNNSYTDYAMLMDVDFIPSFGLFEYLMNTIPVMNHLKQEVLVIPALEFNSYAGFEFPRNKAELLQMWSLRIISSSAELHWKPGHSQTNYDHWRTATKPYRVTYMELYEPYIVGRADLLPLYNVSFLAGFRDKVEHILHVHAIGLKFTVIHDHFTLHLPHNRGTRPPFFPCAVQMYEDFKKMLIDTAVLKPDSFATRPPETVEQPKQKKKITKVIRRRVIRRIKKIKPETDLKKPT